MRPLKKCRKAKNWSLPQLSDLVGKLPGSSISSLHRLETGNVNTVNPNVIKALVSVFSEFGLTQEHITEPEKYPQFTIHYREVSPTKSHHNSDPLPNSTENIVDEQQILIALTNKWLEESAMNVSKFAISLYERLAKASLVKPTPVNADDYSKWVNTAVARVSRILHGDLDLPLSWKHHWVNALPKPVAMSALSQISALTGYMLVPLPTSQQCVIEDCKARIDEISREFADVIQRSGPAMDGRYDEQDDKHELQLLQDELTELTASCLRESSVIERATGVTSKLHQLWRSQQEG